MLKYLIIDYIVLYVCFIYIMYLLSFIIEKLIIFLC